jgi:hypothetical protein
MTPFVLVLAVAGLLPSQEPPKSQAPPAQSPAAAIRQRALDPASLEKEGAKAAGCPMTRHSTTTEDLRGSTASADERLKGMSISGAGTVSGLPEQQGRLGSGKGPSAGSLMANAASLSAADRVPRYYEPADRRPVQSFAFNGEDGKPQSIEALKGKVVLLFLFRTDCKWTLDVLGEIVRLQGLEEKAGIRVIPVSIVNPGWPAVKQFRRLAGRDLPATFPIYLPSDSPATGLEVLGDLKVAPTLLILDREGRVAWRINGATPGSIADKLNLVRLTP